MKEPLSAYQLSRAAESAVVASACAGDAAAFGEIVRRSQNRVRSVMRRLCNHPDLADDLAQQVFLKAWKSIAGLRAPGAFHGWLRKIMVSVWIEELRRRRMNFAEWDETAPVAAPRRHPGERVDLDKALAQLSPPMRLCVVLAYNDGLSHQEICDATGLPLGTVKSNISRGAEKMRLLLSDYAKSDRGLCDAG